MATTNDKAPYTGNNKPERNLPVEADAAVREVTDDTASENNRAESGSIETVNSSAGETNESVGFDSYASSLDHADGTGSRGNIDPDNDSSGYGIGAP